MAKQGKEQLYLHTGFQLAQINLTGKYKIHFNPYFIVCKNSNLFHQSVN